MPAAASVVLALLLGASPEGQGERVDPRHAAPAATHEPTATSAPGGAGEGTAAPAPGGEGEGGSHDAPASERLHPDLVDPWASVPLQRVVPTRPAVVQPVAPRPSVGAPLLDPWAGAARGYVPRQLDPELRDPFHSMRRHPRLARADLRDPFARSGARGTAAPLPPTAAEPPAPEPGMPIHPDLRDPFGRRKPRPAPPAETTPAEATPAPAPRAPAPPSTAPRQPSPPPSDERQPGALVPGALLPSSHPFAHLPRTRRPA